MQKWSSILNDVKNTEAIIKTAIISANNHYAGFGPMTAKIFGKMIGIKEKLSFPKSNYKPSIENREKERYSRFDNIDYKKTKQSSIADFFK